MAKTIAELVRDKLSVRDQNLAMRWEQIYIANRPFDKNIRREEQLRALNHFLRVQLGSLPADTITERECLIDDINVNDWIRIFEEFVLPTMVVQQIPR